MICPKCANPRVVFLSFGTKEAVTLDQPETSRAHPQCKCTTCGHRFCRPPPGLDVRPVEWNAGTPARRRLDGADRRSWDLTATEPEDPVAPPPSTDKLSEQLRREGIPSPTRERADTEPAAVWRMWQQFDVGRGAPTDTW